MTTTSQHTANAQCSIPLVDRLKTATASHHRVVERTGFIRDLLTKNANLQSYILYLRNLYRVYSALETRTIEDLQASKTLTLFINSKINRRASIEKDLCSFMPRDAWRALPIMPSCSSYITHIDMLCDRHPVSLIGHIYVRYLGDMNGGQVLEKLLAQSLKLNSESLNFYRFSTIDDLVSYRQSYRKLFNTMGLTPEQSKSIIDTAILGFEFNIGLSEDIKTYEQTPL